MKRVLRCVFSFIVVWGFGLSTLQGVPPIGGSEPDPIEFRNNILLIIADDLGVDCVGAYGEHPEPGRTPVIDSLAERGMLFRNAWSYHTCSPARAAILTGRHAYRTGIGHYICYENSAEELSMDEESIADILGSEYRTAAVGKWHLSTESGSALRHALDLGFEHHWGSMSNLDDHLGEEAYFRYKKNVDGQEIIATEYATTDAVNDAIELIDSFGNDPWFVWLAFNAPHSPYHKPPGHLHTFDLPSKVEDDLPMHMRAMAEAMDTEMGRLFSSIDPDVFERTVIIFVGDNGTEQCVTTLPFLKEHAKTTVFEGGVNVPLIVAGPGVRGNTECQGLVSLTDLIATVAEIAEMDPPAAEDSISIAPYLLNPLQPSIRAWKYCTRFKPNGLHATYYDLHKAVRDERYKLIYIHEPYSPSISETCFFDLEEDPFELLNLLEGTLSPEQNTAFEELKQAMTLNGP